MKRQIVLMLGLCLFAAPGWASNKAGIVIQNSAGNIISRCVEFDEDAITAEDLLVKSGFKMVTEQSSFGTLLHYLHDDGVEDGSSHPDGWFWNFFTRDGSGWQMASEGISTAQISNGSLIGFAFGAWGVQLPEKTFADVCETVSHAGLVVDHSNGDRTVKVVEFYGETITGLQLLYKSGLELVTNESSDGTALCAIDGEGQPAEDCFDDAQGRYWMFNTLDEENNWLGASTGSSDAIVRDNDVHGYLFGAWGGVQPPIARSEIFELPSGVKFWGAYWN